MKTNKTFRMGENKVVKGLTTLVVELPLMVVLAPFLFWNRGYRRACLESLKSLVS
jgi:hypothetical protein